MKLSFYGADQCVTGSCHCLEVGGKRILIVDDVISTGESLRAVEELVNAAGAIIVGKLAVLAEGDAQTRTDIKYLEKLPVFHPDGTVIEGSIH